MSHYDVKYKGNLEGQEMILKGCQDSLQYCGSKYYRNVVRVVQQTESLDKLYLPLAFAGIQGYPVRALFLRYGQKTMREACRKEEPESDISTSEYHPNGILTNGGSKMNSAHREGFSPSQGGQSNGVS